MIETMHEGPKGTSFLTIDWFGPSSLLLFTLAMITAPTLLFVVLTTHITSNGFAFWRFQSLSFYPSLVHQYLPKMNNQKSTCFFEKFAARLILTPTLFTSCQNNLDG